MTQNDLNSDTISTSNKTAPIEGFEMGASAVRTLLQKELRAVPGNVVIIKETYPQMVSLKLARGKKDPEHTGTIGYLVHGDGSLEELDDKTKLVDVAWGTLGGSALVICYLGLQQHSYRVYSAERMMDLFGVKEGDDSL